MMTCERPSIEETIPAGWEDYADAMRADAEDAPRDTIPCPSPCEIPEEFPF